MAKKDNFDLRSYLIENKMTENSRGEVRHHLGEAKLDTRLFNTGLLVEMNNPYKSDEDLDECGDLNLSDVPLNEEGYTDDTEEFDPTLDAPIDAPVDAPVDDAPAVPPAEGEEGPTSLLDLVNRNDDLNEEDDEDYDDLGDDIPYDPRAEKAAKRQMSLDDPDHDADIERDFTSDAGEGGEEEEVPLSKHNKWVTGEISMDSLFGQNAPNVEIMGDSDDDNKNLQTLFRRHKNYRPSILKSTVEQAMQYFRDYEKPDSLYLIPAIDRGGYEMKRFNPGNRAVAIVYRPEELSGQNWVDQLG